MLKRKITNLIGIAAVLTSSAIGAEVKSDKYPVVSDLNVKLGAYAAF